MSNNIVARNLLECLYVKKFITLQYVSIKFYLHFHFVTRKNYYNTFIEFFLTYKYTIRFLLIRFVMFYILTKLFTKNNLKYNTYK